MALWRLYYHLVWATIERLPLITPETEPKLYDYIVSRAREEGSLVHAIGGIENHVHLVVSIPPRIAIGEFMRLIKGGSSHFVNFEAGQPKVNFNWQKGYGVFSLGETQLEKAVSYARNQKRHHREGTTDKALELIAERDSGPEVKLREQSSG